MPHVAALKLPLTFTVAIFYRLSAAEHRTKECRKLSTEYRIIHTEPHEQGLELVSQINVKFQEYSRSNCCERKQRERNQKTSVVDFKYANRKFKKLEVTFNRLLPPRVLTFPLIY